MKSNFSKCLLMTALITGSVIWGGTNVFAEELQEYSLDQMVVTATRTEKRDVEVPATTNVITEQEIKNRGYVSVFDALEQTVGIQSYSYTGGEGDNGSSTGRTYIRGLDKGTLVLLNGAPINLNNYNSTAGIPISAVEKIEVVKGSNSVLYGSEAMGGVINIITKKAGKINNSIKAVAGNYKKGYEVASSGDKYILSFSRDYYKKFENSSINYKGFDTDRRAYTKNNLFASVNLSKDFTLNYMHTETKNTGMTYLNPVSPPAPVVSAVLFADCRHCPLWDNGSQVPPVWAVFFFFYSLRNLFSWESPCSFSSLAPYCGHNTISNFDYNTKKRKGKPP